MLSRGCHHPSRTWTHSAISCLYLKNDVALGIINQAANTKIWTRFCFEPTSWRPGESFAIGIQSLKADCLKLDVLKEFAAYATRAAVSPLFPVTYLEPVGEGYTLIGAGSSSSQKVPMASGESIRSQQTSDDRYATCSRVLKQNLCCSKCKEVRFCGRECQKVDWTNHKKLCTRRY